jgi:hypothetical protein
MPTSGRNFVDIARFEAARSGQWSADPGPPGPGVLEVSASSLGDGVTISIDGRFDPALVERVLHNLVGDASRHCNQGATIVVAARRLERFRSTARRRGGGWGKVDLR